MDRPTPQEARRRQAVIDARLRQGTPLHRGPTWELYLSDDGIYLVRYREVQLTLYVAIMPDGEVRDPIGSPVDGGDIQIAISTLQSAGLVGMAQKVIAWPMQRRRR
jgi:hypothetical protein